MISISTSWRNIYNLYINKGNLNMHWYLTKYQIGSPITQEQLTNVYGLNSLQNLFSLCTLVAELLWHIILLSCSVIKTIKMSIKKEAQKTFLQVPSSKLLVARIDDDVAKSMPNIHQSIPSSALVRNKGMFYK